MQRILSGDGASPGGLRACRAWAAAPLLSLALACSNDTDIAPHPPWPPSSTSVGGSGSTALLDDPPPPLLPPPPACVPAPVDSYCALFELSFQTSSSWPAVEAYQLRITLDELHSYSCTLTPGGDGADECKLTALPFSVHYDSSGGAVEIHDIVIDRPGRHLHLELGTAGAPRWIEVDQEFTWVPASACQRCVDGGHVTPAFLDVAVPEQPPASPAPPDAGDAGADPGDASPPLDAPDAASDAGAP